MNSKNEKPDTLPIKKLDLVREVVKTMRVRTNILAGDSVPPSAMRPTSPSGEYCNKPR